MSKAEINYVVNERVHLDRMVFLLGTFRAAKNSAFNEHPAFDDALRGPYFYEDGRSIHNYDQVNDDFYIGFQTDYLLVWFASIALIFNLVVIILNCVARIFNLLLLYIIAPPFIASAPLDNGGKLRQWTTAFTIQSLSVFGTVIAMQLMLIYLPIVASPELVLFKDRPMLNAIAQIMLVYGGSEAAKKAGSLVTGILADQAGMEAIRSGDMSGAAGRMINKATSAASGALGMAAGVAGFALSPVTNLAKRPFKAMGDWWRKLGTGEGQSRREKAIKDEIAKNKAIEKYKESHPEDAKYLPGGGGSGSGDNKKSSETPEKNPGGTGDNPDNKKGSGSGDGQPGPAKQPPPIPNRANKSFEAEDTQRHGGPKPGGRVADIRERSGLDKGPGGGRRSREMNNTGSRPSLDKEPPAPGGGGAGGGGGGNPNEAGPKDNHVNGPDMPEHQRDNRGNPPKAEDAPEKENGQEGKGQERPQDPGGDAREYGPLPGSGSRDEENRISRREYTAPRSGYSLDGPPPRQQGRPRSGSQGGRASQHGQGSGAQQGNRPQRQSRFAVSGSQPQYEPQRQYPPEEPRQSQSDGNVPERQSSVNYRGQDSGGAPQAQSAQADARSFEPRQEIELNIPASQRRQGGGAPQSAAYTAQRQESVNIPASRPSGGEGPQTASSASPQGSVNAPRQDASGSAPQQSNMARENAPTGPRSYEPRQESTVNIPASQRRSGGGERQGYTQPGYTRPQYTQPQYTQPENTRPQNTQPQNTQPQYPADAPRQPGDQQPPRQTAPPQSQRGTTVNQAPQSAPRQTNYQQAPQQATYEYRAPQASAPRQTAPPQSQRGATVNQAPQSAPRQANYQQSPQQATYEYRAPQASAPQQAAPPQSQRGTTVTQSPQSAPTEPQGPQPGVRYQPQRTASVTAEPRGPAAAPGTRTEPRDPAQRRRSNTDTSGSRPGGLPGSERNKP